MNSNGCVDKSLAFRIEVKVSARGEAYEGAAEREVATAHKSPSAMKKPAFLYRNVFCHAGIIRGI